MQQLKAYPYLQYRDDASVAQFFTAHNALASEYLAWFDYYGFRLSNYQQLSGAALDFVGENLYGYKRPILVSHGSFFDTSRFDLTGFDTPSAPLQSTGGQFFDAAVFDITNFDKQAKILLATDDAYKRILDWRLNRAEGYRPTIQGIKRKIQRFVTIDVQDAPVVNMPYQDGGFVITTARSYESELFDAAVFSNAVDLPLEIKWSVQLT